MQAMFPRLVAGRYNPLRPEVRLGTAGCMAALQICCRWRQSVHSVYTARVCAAGQMAAHYSTCKQSIKHR
jgi:hypothetical protein